MNCQQEPVNLCGAAVVGPDDSGTVLCIDRPGHEAENRPHVAHCPGFANVLVYWIEPFSGFRVARMDRTYGHPTYLQMWDQAGYDTPPPKLQAG